MSTMTAMPPLAELAGLDVVPSRMLPAPPSPGEDARRIVRHGFHDAGLWPAACGEVGPRPGQPTRAIKIGRQLLVDHLLWDEIRTEADRQRRRADSARRRQAQERADLQAIATSLGVRRVTAHLEPDYARTLYRAHTEPEGAAWKDGPQVRIDHDELRRLPNTSAVIAHVAHRLRQVLAERKLDEEEAARGGDR
jgi:hypothetical protein